MPANIRRVGALKLTNPESYQGMALITALKIFIVKVTDDSAVELTRKKLRLR